MFSALQCMNPALKGTGADAVAKFREELGKARRHVEFCCEIYEYQLRRGAHFIHEHPWNAKSWQMNCVSRIVHDKRVMVAMVDQCRFGLTTTDKDWEEGPARNRTGFISSSWTVIDELHGACDGLHEHHNHLIDGRAKEAAIYPPRLCRAISAESQDRRCSTRPGRTSVRP